MTVNGGKISKNLLRLQMDVLMSHEVLLFISITQVELQNHIKNPPLIKCYQYILAQIFCSTRTFTRRLVDQMIWANINIEQSNTCTLRILNEHVQAKKKVDHMVRTQKRGLCINQWTDTYKFDGSLHSENSHSRVVQLHKYVVS